MTQGREMNHWMALLLASVTLGAAPVRNEAALPGTQALDWPSDGKGIVFCESDSRLWLANSELGVEFLQAGDGLRLSRLVGRQQGGDFLASNSRRAAGGFWQLVLRRDRGRDGHEVTVSSRDAATVSSRCEGGPAERTLRLRWQGLAVADEPNALDAEVTVALSANSPLSRWRIAVTNRSRTWGLWKVLFPSIALAPIGGDPAKNYLTLGRARGIVVRDPFQPTNGPAFGVSSSTGLNWPGSLNMQFQALYASDGAGFYLATHDGGGFKKTFYVLPQRGQPALDYQVGHWPANMGWPAEDFHLSYDVCLGPFRGDWFDACQLYRQWATRQAWCACGPRAMRRDVPRWFEESPAAFYLMNYYGESQVPMFRQRIGDYSRLLGVELPVTWYVWKKHVPEMTDYNRPGSPWRVPEARAYPCGNIHDGNYPRLPALPSFGEACRSVAAQGAHVQAYVCAQIYDPGLNENAPYAADARPSVIRDVHGELQAAERNKVGWLMCGRTKWWQQRLAETVTELVHREHVGGIYFDTFYGGYVQCFDTSHGHSHGGGRDPYLADRELSTVVRGAMKRAAPEAVMTGENPAETAIDLLDGFLYRWTMWPDMQPLSATVYGDYICRHGMQLDVASDAFWGQTAVLFTEGAQMGWLAAHGVECRPFDPTPGRDKGNLVILMGDGPATPNRGDIWRKLTRRVAKGSVTVFLKPSAFAEGSDSVRWLPLENKGQCRRSHNWVYHREDVAKRHPIFEGLPAGGIMDWYYYLQLTPQLLFDGQTPPDDTAAAAFAPGAEGGNGYTSGLIAGSYRFGAGRFVLNTFRILENLDHNPAADRLLLNMVHYAAGLVKQP